ncbi:MAG: TIGR00730 family Rossman fold protein [Candidatus Cloacimonetes bacterium]|nr:TIGR00730 family Rossman fold protein [Candidatus Cloacimonadota bacterium]MCF7815343.1 TIGR00730 family Rossman fold protein [Candidatus Cloacimonadota bacterium]MCF7867758.1 TIGR00730 family Rossman fold protein [Candidatus Cloacimonadota bacterium]MCF7883156.1 TIGR00730 family Rossman fold protein [Candidatus Cloacimonadota bacterium]
MKKICVFCGSSPGADPEFSEVAKELGKEIAYRNLELIYGASDLGLMGVLAESAIQNGAKVIGVMPRIFDGKVEHPDLAELHIVEGMHQRKSLMYDMGDAFMALPGGMGTFEEILEVVTWAQIGYHQKPCGLLNINGFFDQLLEFLNNSVKQRFIWEAHRKMLMSDTRIEGLFNQFENYKAPNIEKWRDRK